MHVYSLSQVMFIHDVQVKLQPLPRPPSTRLSALKKDTNYSSIIFEANQNGDRVDVSLKTEIRL